MNRSFTHPSSFILHPLILLVLLWAVPCAAQTPADTGVVLLRDLLAEARAKNPEIRAARLRVDAARSRVPQAGALPNPMAMYELNNIGLGGFSVGREDMSMTGFSLTQAIPFPGKRRLRTEAAEAERLAYEERAAATELAVLAQVKAAYYDLYRIHRSLEVLDHHQTVLRSFSQTASSRYAVGEGIAQDILKAQVEISRLMERRRLLEQEQHATEAIMNRLLDRPPADPLDRPETPARTPLSYTQEDLIAMADRQTPVLRAWDRVIERQQAGVALAKRESYPDFSVSGGWFTRGDMDDLYRLSIGVELPLYYRRKQRNMVAENRAMAAEAEAEREAARRMLQADIREQYTLARTTDELADLYEQVILPQARASLESSVAGYSVGKVDFLTLLDSLMSLIEDELRYHEHVVDHQKALARLEPLTGATIIE